MVHQPERSQEVRSDNSAYGDGNRCDSSQEIKSEDTDTFLIDLIIEERDSGKDHVFLATFSLVYDEDDKRISREIIFAPSPVYESAYTGAGEGWILREDLDPSDAKKLTAENRDALEGLQQDRAVKDDNAAKLLQSVS